MQRIAVRLTVAVLAALAAIPLALALHAAAYRLSGAMPSSVSLAEVGEGIAAASVVGTPVALLLIVLYGLPLFFLLRRLGLANLTTCTIAGLLPAVAYAIYMRDMGYFTSYGFIALLSAWAFWSVARHICRAPPANNALERAREA